MITSPCNLEPEVGPLRPGECQRLNGDRYSFITLQPSNIQETGDARAASRRPRCESLAVDSWMNDTDPFRANTASHEVVPRALADRMKFRPSVRPGKWALSGPDRRGFGPGCLGKCSGAEKVRHNGTEGEFGTRRQKQRKFV